MDIEDIKKIKGNLIISCQAYEDNPLYGVDNIVTLAKCALKGGAAGLRLCWPDAIRAVRKLTDLPIVGINKVMNQESFDRYRQVFITPTYESAVQIIEAGCDIVALDGTLRNRKREDLAYIISKLKKQYPHILLMADIATMQEGKMCEEIGFDILSSTLSGYTEETKNKKDKEPDFEFIRQLKEETNCLVNAEGRIWNLEHLKKIQEMDVDMITIGTAITNPMATTAYFCSELNALRKAVD